MKWTKDQPTVSGHYWTRSLREGGTPFMHQIVDVQLKTDNEFSFDAVYETGGDLNADWMLTNESIEWAGPILIPDDN